MRVAVCGFGYWGPNLVRNFLSDARVTVAAICDLSPDQLKRAAKMYPNIKGTNNFSDVLSDGSIDAIAIATPVFTHFELAKSALEAKKHVLIEKPLTFRLQESNELIEVAKKVQRVLMVDHTYLYSPAVRKIKALVQSGGIGQVKYFDSTRINLGLVQPDINVLWDLAAHDISILQYLLDERPACVQATGGLCTAAGIENIGYLTMKYESGFIAHFNCSWASPVKVRHILIGGDKKMVLFNDLEPTEKIRVYDTGYNVQTDEDKRMIMVDYRVGDIYIPQLEKYEPLASMVKDFVDCAKERGRIPVASAELGRDVVATLSAAQTSLSEGGREVRL